MAEDKAQAAEQPEATPNPAGDQGDVPKGGLRLLVAKLKFLLFAAAVVIVECLVAYFCLPAAARSSAVAASEAGTAADPESLLAEPSTPPEDQQVEVDLGEYSVTAFQPRSGTTLRVDFHLYATVKKEDQEAFDAAIKTHQNRVRDQVLATIRSCELSDLNDAGLGLIKRRILAKVNDTFGKYLIQSIVFSDFSFIEQ